MTISDSNPVQFWLIDEETFNEKEVCGLIRQECFCQPFQCDDDIKIQFQDDSPFHWQLFAFDSDSALIGEFDFSEVADGYWEASIDFNESPCDQMVSFKIGKSEAFSDGDFNDGTGTYTNTEQPDAWYMFDDGAVSYVGQWSHSSFGGDLAAYCTLTTSSSSANKNVSPLAHLFQQLTYGFRRITYNIRQGAWSNTFGTWTGGTVRAVYYLNGVEVGFQVIVPALAQNTTYSGNFDTNVSGFDAISIRVIWTSTGSPFLGTNEIYILQFQISGLVGPVYVAKSDCIDLKESHDCTQLIEYENTSNFDGINYEAGSPGPSFQLRIPAIFFEEENPQEQEDLELSNGVIVTLRQSILEKRKLETGYMPNYMHRKLQKVLMHDSVLIDGDYWKKRDAYDTNPIKKYNLKTASVLLTKYDSVEKNTM